jgi:hypothetical protein
MVRLTSKHNVLLAGDPLLMAMKSFGGWAVIPFRYSMYRKSDSLNSTPKLQHLITQGGMVRFGSTMACFLAERHLF